MRDMTDPHAQHDRTLIAALATRPDDPTDEVELARALVASCGPCADLLADLIGIQAAVPHAAIPTRPRDFMLSEADAARLGRGGWRRFLAMVGSSSDRVSRPLAVGLTTLGLAAVLVATLPGGIGSGATSGSPAEVQRVDEPVSAAGGADPERYSMSAGPDTAGVDETAPPPAQEGDREVGSATDLRSGAIRDDATGLSTLLVLGGVLVILGVGLFGLRWTARRFGDG